MGNSSTAFPSYLSFDDVLLRPKYSDISPGKVSVKSKLTKEISLNIPILSAAMDTVTESSLAIVIAQLGGMGIIHRNLSPQKQAEEVIRVKRFESGVVHNPITITSNAKLSEALSLMRKHNISGIPVVENTRSNNVNKLVGIITNRDVRFAENMDQPISELMTRKLFTAPQNITHREAQIILRKHKIEKLLVIDENYSCVGIITVKDIEKSKLYPNSCKDNKGRLRVGASCSVGNDGYERALCLIDAGADCLVLDTAHGHSRAVIEQVQKIKKSFPNVAVIAGNVATADGTKALIDAGADAIKIGIGPGSICTTRIIAGVGVPQLSALLEAFSVAKGSNIPIIADGGIKYSGDLVKALAAGAGSVMIGSLLAGTDESPGEVFFHHGRAFKSYRGMGSVEAMSKGSRDRYFQEDILDSFKLVPEGVEGKIPYRGKLSSVLYQLVGGLRSAMGYLGAKNITELQDKAEFIRISPAGFRESHVHDVSITKESPNYPSS